MDERPATLAAWKVDRGARYRLAGVARASAHSVRASAEYAEVVHPENDRGALDWLFLCSGDARFDVSVPHRAVMPASARQFPVQRFLESRPIARSSSEESRGPRASGADTRLPSPWWAVG